MDRKTFNNNRLSLNEYCEQLLDVKGNDYTTGGDRLDNFKKVAEMVGVTPLQVWAVYSMKHIFALLKYVRSGAVQSEPIEGRFADARNYIDLGYGLHVERVQSQTGGGCPPDKRQMELPFKEDQPTPKGWYPHEG